MNRAIYRHRSNPLTGPTVRPRSPRSAFSLVELLVAIAIIGILIGMLSVAFGPAIKRSREFAVTSEMKQIELAFENFKNKYGFYPPSFSSIGNANQLLPYLNKLSPNHRENVGARLATWYATVGTHLDDRSSLVFWLSGLFKNKQYPITGGMAITTPPVAYNAKWVVDSGVEVANANVPEREVLFDFRNRQLSAADPLTSGTRLYNMPYGDTSNDLSYRYRNAAAYTLGTTTLNDDAYYIQTDEGAVHFNPRSFQLTTLGLDGLAAAPVAVNPPTNASAAVRKQRQLNNDNITNFAGGRLDAFDWTTALDLGGATPQ